MMGKGDIHKILKEGLDAPMNSRECKEFRKTHENCLGCKYISGCKEFISRYGQFVAQDLIQQGALPNDFDWHEHMTKQDELEKEKNGA